MTSQLAKLLLGCAYFATSATAAGPNVILIVTDDQGYGDMSCHGNPWVNTPNLDRFASQGVQLEDYHVDPVCTPTRAALMTGRYCTRAGAWTTTEGRQLLRDGEVTMAEVFHHSGYRTGMFGKWHLGDTWPYAPRFRGFDQVVCHRAGGVDEIGNPTGNDFFDDVYYRNGKPEPFTGYCTDVFFHEAMEFIEDQSEQPFFVYLPLNAMHSPHTVAERYVAPFVAQGHPIKRAKFYGMIVNFDENLGRLLNSLKKQSIDQETVVIFMGDNGNAVGMGSPNDTIRGFNAGMRGQKGSVYEGGHRVACFVRWPQELQAGMVVDQLTSHRDWLPTLIDLCQLEMPRDTKLDGRSISSLLRGNSRGWKERTFFVERQGDEPDLPSRTVGRKRYPHYAVLTERWRMVDGELYDHERDPGQRVDVADEHPDVANHFYERFVQHHNDVFGEGRPYTRFKLGGDENLIEFTVRDWHPVGATAQERRVIWQRDQLGEETLFINGFWEVDVLHAGEYAIRLSRFPDDALEPMGAIAAKLKIGEQVETQPIDPADQSAVFLVELPQSPLRLQAWLTDARSGDQRGAYFVRITHVK